MGTTERVHFHFLLSCTGEGNGTLLQYSCLENPRIPGTEEPNGLPSMGSHRAGHDWSDLAAAAAADTLEKAMASHSSTLAWKIPWMEEPDGLPSMGSHRVGHDWSNLAVEAFITWCFTDLYFLNVNSTRAKNVMSCLLCTPEPCIVVHSRHNCATLSLWITTTISRKNYILVNISD